MDQKITKLIATIFALLFVSVVFFGCNNSGIEGNTVLEETNENTQQDTSIITFNDCLAENGMVVYGAEWCPHCTKVVETLGGYDAADSVYVECTQEQSLCQSEGVRAYPTIRFNEEDYKGARTLEAFAQQTGCTLPSEA